MLPVNIYAGITSFRMINKNLTFTLHTRVVQQLTRISIFDYKIFTIYISVHCYAKLAISSIAMAVTIASTHFAYP